MRGLAASLILAPWLWLAAPVIAQEAQTPPDQSDLRSPVLTIDPNRLFAQSLFGQRVAAEYEAARKAFGEENQEIAQALLAEEKSLTERRPTMEPEAFRAEAEAFDAKVQGIRNAQDAKELSLEQILSDGREVFFGNVEAVIGPLMVRFGGLVIIDNRTVFLKLDAIDITNAAIEAYDEALGDGSAAAGGDK